MANIATYRPIQAVPTDVMGQFARGFALGKGVRGTIAKRKIAQLLSEAPNPEAMLEETPTEGAIPAGEAGAATTPTRRYLTAQDWADYRERGAKVLAKWGTADDIKSFNEEVDKRKLTGFNNLANQAIMAMEGGDLASAKSLVESAWGYYADGVSPNVTIENDPRTGRPGLRITGTKEKDGTPLQGGVFVDAAKLREMQAMFGGDAYKFIAMQQDKQLAASRVALQEAQANKINKLLGPQIDELISRGALTEAQATKVEQEVRELLDTEDVRKKQIEAALQKTLKENKLTEALTGLREIQAQATQAELDQYNEWDDVLKTLKVMEGQGNLSKIAGQLENWEAENRWLDARAESERIAAITSKYTGLTENQRQQRMQEIQDGISATAPLIAMQFSEESVKDNPDATQARETLMRQLAQMKAELEWLNNYKVSDSVITKAPVGTEGALPTGAEPASATMLEADRIIGAQ